MYYYFPYYFRDFCNLDIDYRTSKMEQNHFKRRKPDFKVAEITEIIRTVTFQNKEIIVHIIIRKSHFKLRGKTVLKRGLEKNGKNKNV